MSFTSPESTPACTAAPTATTSSGFTLWSGSLPKNFFTVSLTSGMRVEPPTRRTSFTSFTDFFASASALRTGSIERSTSGVMSCSSLARERRRSRCTGPPGPTVMNGRLMLVSCTLESSILAFSAASFRRWRAILSLETSMPELFLNSATIQSMTRLSTSSPPRWVSPLVEMTCTTLSPTSRIEMSKVPPPKS